MTLNKNHNKKTSETINSKATLSSRTFQEQWQTRGDFPNSCPAHPFLVPSSPSTPSLSSSSPSLSSSSSFNRHDYRQLPNSSLMGYLKPTVALIVVDCAMLLWLLTISHKIIENENVAFFFFLPLLWPNPHIRKVPRHLVRIVFWRPIFGPKWPIMYILGPILPFLGPKPYFSRGSNSFGTHLSENQLGTSFLLYFGRAYHQNGPERQLFGSK